MPQKKSSGNGVAGEVWYALWGAIPLFQEKGARLFREASGRGRRVQEKLTNRLWKLPKKIPLIGSKIGFEKTD